MIPELANAADRALCMTDGEFAQLRTLILERIGISLTDKKRSLVENCWRKLMRGSEFTTFEQYYDYLRKDRTGEAIDALANRITTNYTYFYREEAHFDYFVKTALPTVVTRIEREDSRDLRVWCAACSTGEEPYTLAMLLLDYFGPQYDAWNAGILATDISRAALEDARKAVYRGKQLTHMPPMLRQRYLRGIGGDLHALRWEVKREVTFRRFNLVNAEFPFKRPFHVIFCRNVMIYFDQPTRRALAHRLCQFLESGGYLFLSHTETLDGTGTTLRRVAPSVYRKDGF